MKKAKHGGPRPGSGRKPLPPEDASRMISIRLSPPTLAALDTLSERWQTTRTGAIERAVDEAVK